MIDFVERFPKISAVIFLCGVSLFVSSLVTLTMPSDREEREGAVVAGQNARRWMTANFPAVPVARIDTGGRCRSEYVGNIGLVAVYTNTTILNLACRCDHQEQGKCFPHLPN